MYKLSIAVPTKDRFDYLKYLIDAYLEINTEYIELVISDNSNTNELCFDYLKKISNNNIKYYHSQVQMSQAENCNYAISKCNGKFVTLLGDDDCISAKILDVTKYMEEMNIQSSYFTKIIYRWPDVELSKENIRNKLTANAHLRIPVVTGKITSLNTTDELVRCLQEGFHRLGKMPRVYHGIIEKKILDTVYTKTGTYFPGPSPDMASSVALSLVVSSHVIIDYPYIFSGQGFNSAAGLGLRNKHKGNLSEIHFLPKNIEDLWDNRIPKIWTGETIYIISAISALKSMSREDLINKTDFSNHYANFLSNHREYKSMVIDKIHENDISLYLILFRVFLIHIRKWLSLIKWNFLKRSKKEKNLNYYKVPNSIMAAKIADSKIGNL